MRYQHLFFDLDHTLWDFDKNAAETLRELYVQYNLHSLGSFTDAELVHHFLQINHSLWDLYNTDQITQQALRETRFPRVFQALGIENFGGCDQLAADYLLQSPQKPHLVPYAKEVLSYLHTRYTLHLITNGFADMQSVKTDCAGITTYFDQVITSEKAGCRKPNRQIFDYALRVAGAQAAESLMIGDSWACDIVGAKNAGLDHVFYNPTGAPCEGKPTHHIRCLRELMQIL